MEMRDIYRLAFESVLLKYGYDTDNELVDRIFKLCDDEVIEGGDWEHEVILALEVVNITLDSVSD